MASWELYVNENRAYGKEIPDNAKYHCFVDNKSLCGKYYQKYGDYETSIESGEILSNPQFACKVCYKRWKKKFNLD